MPPCRCRSASPTNRLGISANQPASLEGDRFNEAVNQIGKCDGPAWEIATSSIWLLVSLFLHRPANGPRPARVLCKAPGEGDLGKLVVSHGCRLGSTGRCPAMQTWQDTCTKYCIVGPVGRWLVDRGKAWEGPIGPKFAPCHITQ